MALIIRRKIGESIELTDEEGAVIATITIHGVGRQVELAITARPDVEVERVEPAKEPT